VMIREGDTGWIWVRGKGMGLGESIKERMEGVHIQRPGESSGSVTTLVCEERCNGVYMASRLAFGFVYDLAHWNEISGWIGSKGVH
jgi:hypothetical protein